VGLHVLEVVIRPGAILVIEKDEGVGVRVAAERNATGIFNIGTG